MHSGAFIRRRKKAPSTTSVAADHNCSILEAIRIIHEISGKELNYTTSEQAKLEIISGGFLM